MCKSLVETTTVTVVETMAVTAFQPLHSNLGSRDHYIACTAICDKSRFDHSGVRSAAAGVLKTQKLCI